MFKSCCARPNKKINKNKSSSESSVSTSQADMDITQEKVEDASEENQISDAGDVEKNINDKKPNPNEISDVVVDEEKLMDNSKELGVTESTLDEGSDEKDILQNLCLNRDFSKKRYSMDYKKSRMDFKRFSVDYRKDSDTLIQLERLQEELSRTNVDVQPGGRRKSSGILKSTTSSNGIGVPLLERTVSKADSVSDDDEVFESTPRSEVEGPREPPATPVGRDELALRRHRFFSDLVCAARAAVEHRVRFDPLGPVVADTASGEADGASVAPCAAAELEALIERLEKVTSRLERLPLLQDRSPTPLLQQSDLVPPSSPAATPLVNNMSVNGYQDIVQGPLRSYLALSQQIGGDVAAHAGLVNSAFQAQLQYINLAAARSKPSQPEEMKLLAPTSEQINAIQQFREKNRASPFFNHLSAISESIPALGWVAISPTPGPYVKEMNDAGQFYTNRVLKDWKEKDKRHVDWCKSWVQLLTDLQAYVKQYHTTGLVWSGKGAGAPPPPPPGGMPPPPPVLPEVDFNNLSVDDRSALFAEINQGEKITSSLRKVTSDMQTHKNPQLRTGPAPFKAAPAPAAAAGRPGKPLPTPGAGAIPDKPPVFARDGKKWLIEYQKGNPNLVVENADMNNVVYMFRCRDSALTVRGKVNGIILDSCTKCAVVFDNLVSSIEFVNCQSVQMQVLGKVPTISVDKTDGCQMYLSAEARDVEVVSSKSSEMNVLVPNASGDYTEYPIPEQFKTVLNKTGLSTAPVENKG